MQNSLISKEHSDGLKGWMCIAVLIHHLAIFSGIFDNTWFGHFLYLLGSWAVAVFLFLSGYGLYCSYAEKGMDYLKGFFRKRFLPLYASYAVAVVVYFTYDFKTGMTAVKVIKSLTWGGTIVSFGWFFQMLFVMYLLFFFVFRFCKNKYLKSGIIGAVLLTYLIFAHCFGQYDTPIIAFATGMIAGVHRASIRRFIQKYTGLVMPISFMAFFAVYMLYVLGTIMGKFQMGYVTWGALSVLAGQGIIWFAVCICTICEKHRARMIDNPVMQTIKKISFEVYVLQGIVIRSLSLIIENRVIFFFAAFAAVMILAVPFHFVIKMINKLIKEKSPIVIPLIHFILSFAYERAILIFDKGDFSVISTVKANIISDIGERIIGYVLSKVFAGIIIFLFWKLIFYIIKNIRNNVPLISFCGIFAVFTPVVFHLFPDSFMRSVDNLITYSYAIRFFPEYWHNAYTSIIYCACLMVFPHPFSIALIQWMFFLFLMGYIFIKSQKIIPGKRALHILITLFFLIPGTFTLITNPYRTELYALVSIFYVAYIIFTVLDKDKPDTKKTVMFILLGAFLGVWRTEGIVLAVFGTAAYFVAIRAGIKRAAIFIIGFILSFIVISIPQKLGDSKYYPSNDYMMVNSFESLRNILLRPDADTSYAGADKDLKRIDSVVPTELIKAYALDGYRRYNFKNGHTDINQSMATKEEGKEYLKGYLNLLSHNPVIYLKTQGKMLGMVLDVIPVEEFADYSDGMLSEEYPPWNLPAWMDGFSDYLFLYPGMDGIFYSQRRAAFSERVYSLYDRACDAAEKRHISTAIYLMVSGALVFICLREFIAAIRGKKEKDKDVAKHIALFILSGGLLLQAIAVILVMPAGLSAYFHPFIYGTITMEVIYPYFVIKDAE